jgi:hypothetical protein
MSEKIEKLLEKIELKEMVLPEFQREYTWNRDQVKKLFVSLFKGYPTGSLLIWETSNPPKIKNDAYDLESLRRVNVLLDGQQRLTSLYLNVKGEVPPFYNDEEIKDSYFDLYFNLKTGEFKYYKKMEMKNNPFWYKVFDIFADPPTVFSLFNSIDDDMSLEEKNELGDRIEKNLNKLRGVLKKDYPIQEVPADSDLKEAIKVFDLINSQGTPLTNADIALAYMTAEWPDIRRNLKNKLAEMAEDGFDLNLSFMTHAVAGILSGRGSLSDFVKTNINDITKEDLIKTWEKLDEKLNYLISLLKSDAYIVGTDDINTPYALIPIIVYLSEFERLTGRVKKKMLYWFYASLYQRRYSSSPETSLEQDVTDILKVGDPEILIENLKEEEGNPQLSSDNLDMRGVRHPIYNMMCIVIRSNGAVDWNNGLALEENTGDEFKIEKHHIFPKSVLKRNGWLNSGNQYHRKRMHEIANRIPLTKSGNMNIFDKKPKEYLPQVQKDYPGVLRRSFVPTNDELWQVDNYEDFLAKRRELIVNGINEFMDNLIEDDH